ncbi:MAG: Coq4 family protein [Phenylobacterium sp.]|uniref:Coq4 family protein n=1 Tax=Phenylobacterium sp. TaxID=1871053 RepID=UPI0027344943|nr:Coq4 family protein [Phenylobacterium sp.]MDP3745577.1 Coq4 family protein [Phenylobacterium sp.]
MIDPQARERFEDQAVRGGDAAEAQRLAACLKGGEGPAGLQLAALFVHVAAVAPEHLAAVYDGAAEGWLGWQPRGLIVEGATGTEAPPAGFWTEFWALALEPVSGQSALEVTARTAALAGQLAPEFKLRVAAMAGAYPGVAQAAAAGYPSKFSLERLALCPPESLGGAFHALIVDNGFDLEVLDRDALGLADLPAPLDYLNARILQCHDLWHLLAGYRTTALHEVAISAFQMAQFGHHYSSMFLGMVLTKTAVTQAEALPLFLDTILTAWTHGRETPPLIGLDWEAIWDRPLEVLRAELGVTAYSSPYPADLFEQLRAA